MRVFLGAIALDTPPDLLGVVWAMALDALLDFLGVRELLALYSSSSLSSMLSL